MTPNPEAGLPADDAFGAVGRRAYRGAQRVALDPRTRAVLRAGPRAAMFLRRARQRTGSPGDDSVVPVPVTAALASQVLLDELLIAMFKHPALIPGPDDFAAAERNVTAAVEMYAERGWLDDPRSYHQDPPRPYPVVDSKRVMDVRYEHVRCASRWEPYPGEPGRERWLAHEPNRISHTWVLRGDQDTRRWLVAVHGFGMGRPYMDVRAFRATALHRRGLNVALPVLPLHGPRTTSRTRGEGFMSIDLVDSKHGMAQAAWDVRRLIRWLREEHGAEQIGLYGMSLGGHVVSLVAALEENLDCVVAAIPVVDLPDLYRRHSTPETTRLGEQHNVLGPLGDAVHRVVSPLAMPPLLARDRRFIVAGVGDRMSTFGQARRLWEHWERPEMASYRGGHVGLFWSGEGQRFLTHALEQTGLLDR